MGNKINPIAIKSLKKFLEEYFKRFSISPFLSFTHGSYFIECRVENSLNFDETLKLIDMVETLKRENNLLHPAILGCIYHQPSIELRFSIDAVEIKFRHLIEADKMNLI